jgi:hypothetical protein
MIITNPLLAENPDRKLKNGLMTSLFKEPNILVP